jgi:hypothetical protein
MALSNLNKAVVSPVTAATVNGIGGNKTTTSPNWLKPSTSYTNDGLAHQNPFNTGIGDWFGNMNKWKSMNGDREGKHIGQGGAADIMDLNKNGVGGALGNAWMDNGNPHGQYNQQLYDAMRGYTYKGADGKQYMINGNYYHGGGYDQEGANTAGDLMYGGVGALGHPDKGRKIGEMSYSVTGFKPDWGGDMGAFNGQGFDMYDKDGKYVGGNLPMSMGDDQFNKHALTTAAMVATAGLGGAALAGAQAGGGIGAGLAGASNPVMAVEAAGLGAGGLGSMGSAGLTAGGAGTGLGGVGSNVGGHGAFVGEGAWTPTAGGGAMPGGFGGTAGGAAGGATTGGLSSGGSSGLQNVVKGVQGLNGLLGGGQGGGGLLGMIPGLVDADRQGDASDKMLEWMNGQQAKIDALYKPGSPEYNALFDQMARQDAAAGRNSQYGPRSVDLAARIADIKGKYTASLTNGLAGNYQSAFNQDATKYSSLLGGLGNMGGGGSLFDMFGSWLGGSSGGGLGSSGFEIPSNTFDIADWWA